MITTIATTILVLILIYIISFILTWILIRRQMKIFDPEGFGCWAIFLVILPIINTVFCIYALGSFLSKQHIITKIFFCYKDGKTNE